MKALRNNLANQITATRLLVIPLLWVCAFLSRPIWIGIGLVYCALSDYFDGVVARRRAETSAFGSRLDSIADQLLLLSTVVWVGMLRPALFLDHQLWVILSLGIYLASLLTGLVKFRRIANLHLTSSRWATYALYALLIQTFLMEQHSVVLFWIAWGLFTLSSTETLILQLVNRSVDEHMGSVLNAWREGRR